MSISCGYAFLYAHSLLLLIVVGGTNVLLDAQSSLNILSGTTGYGSGCVDAALTALAFLGKKVSTEGALTSHFTSLGNLDTLRSTFVGLELWHYLLLITSTTRSFHAASGYFFRITTLRLRPAIVG